MRVGLAAFVLAVTVSVGLAGGEKAPKKDARLGPPRHYDLKYFPWTPPTTKEAWEAQRKRVREKILVATGLWPMPEKTPLNAVIHGKIARDGYTIEKVFFASYPGHYVSGNLYRPTGKTGKLPAILSPHGHWANGRMYEAGDKEVAAQLKSGAEKTVESAKYPLQARCAQLARLGCVVFHYDMVGNADSQQIPHRQGFTDVDAELRMQNFMGLQTWNSIRALDFLCDLPDVDTSRIGVTGASGGGTQTFILCAIDDRPAAAFPAVMVGTAMQGGCICENCSYLRIDGNNVQIAACMAPRPLGMSAANDWTKDIMTKGLPELKKIYGLYGVPENLMAEAHLEFGHNYNQVSREIMYNFFNKHLKLGHEGHIREQPFVPVPPKELSVYDGDHPRPKDATNAEGLRRYLTAENDKQLAALMPKDKASFLAFNKVMRPALRTMITDSLPPSSAVEQVEVSASAPDAYVSRKDREERVLVSIIAPRDSEKWTGRMVVCVDPNNQDEQSLQAARKALAKLVDRNDAIAIVQPFRTENATKAAAPAVNKAFAGYTFGYNRPLLAQRVHDILTAIAYVKGRKGVEQIDLVGFGDAGPWVALARGLCYEKVRRTAADMNGFRFEQVKDANDPMMLPGGLRYGGLLTLAALAVPHEMLLYNTKGCGSATFLNAAYRTAGHPDRLQLREETMAPAAVVEWLLR